MNILAGKIDQNVRRNNVLRIAFVFCGGALLGYLATLSQKPVPPKYADIKFAWQPVAFQGNELKRIGGDPLAIPLDFPKDLTPVDNEGLEDMQTVPGGIRFTLYYSADQEMRLREWLFGLANTLGASTNCRIVRRPHKTVIGRDWDYRIAVDYHNVRIAVHGQVYFFKPAELLRGSLPAVTGASLRAMADAGSPIKDASHFESLTFVCGPEIDDGPRVRPGPG